MTDIRPTSAPTLEMVAAAAGVSRSTVSRVINDSPKVTPEAFAAVQAAIDKLGYVPNRAARILASRRTMSIALVIPENTAKFFADPYFAAVVQGVATYLSETDYTLTLLIAAESDAEKTRSYLQAGNVDGAIILSHHSDDRSYVALARSIPVVFGGRPTSADGVGAYYVDVDNVLAAQEVTERLIQRGRTRIATIAGPQNMSAGIDRLQGWQLALNAAGLTTDLVEYGDFSPASGEAAMRRLSSNADPLRRRACLMGSVTRLTCTRARTLSMGSCLPTGFRARRAPSVDPTLVVLRAAALAGATRAASGTPERRTAHEGSAATAGGSRPGAP